MTQLFFMDESGHVRNIIPYEVRGGFAIHVGELWPFVQKMRYLEIECFGCRLKEIKGSKLLKKDVFRWAGQAENFSPGKRRELSKKFLEKNNGGPNQDQFTAYGQACLAMAHGIFQLLVDSKAVVFAVAIPRGAQIPQPNFQFEDYMRKDAVYLFERFFLGEEKNDYGLIVMDETEKMMDRRFVARMEKYFTKTKKGQDRANLIVPSPFFVSSDTAVTVQVADLCIFAINWGFRLPKRGMSANTRPEISNMFGSYFSQLQYRRKSGPDLGYVPYGITYVSDPYNSNTSEIQ